MAVEKECTVDAPIKLVCHTSLWVQYLSNGGGGTYVCSDDFRVMQPILG